MAEGKSQLSVLVEDSVKEAAKENTAHGEISRKVRELLSNLAEGDGELPPTNDTTTRKEQLEKLEDSEGYPADWDERRKEVFLRDNYMCQNCGDRGGRDGHASLQGHHIVPADRGGTHYLSNLTTLCKSCHDDIHGF